MDLDDQLIRDARRLSVATYRSLLDRWDGPAAVQRLHSPLLVVQGRNDQLQPPRQSELLFDAANNPKDYLLVDTGHLPHLEDPSTLGDGTFFKVLARDGAPVDEPFFRDTVLVRPKERVDVGLVPLDEGTWMMHCHILEHAESGMMTLFRVAGAD